MRDDLIALLETGPSTSGDLTKYLGPPTSRILSELRKLVREGLVTTVGVAKKWALVPIANVQSTSVPAAAPVMKPRTVVDEAAEDDELLDEISDEDDEAADAGDGLDEIAYEADVAPARRGRPALRQAPETTLVSTEPSWWCQAPPHGFTAEAEKQLERMSASKEARRGRYRSIGDE